jgi:hypothetical protein
MTREISSFFFARRHDTFNSSNQCRTRIESATSWGFRSPCLEFRLIQTYRHFFFGKAKFDRQITYRISAYGFLLEQYRKSTFRGNLGQVCRFLACSCVVDLTDVSLGGFWPEWISLMSDDSPLLTLDAQSCRLDPRRGSFPLPVSPF